MARLRLSLRRSAPPAQVSEQWPGPLLDVRGLRVKVDSTRGCGYAVDGVDLTIGRGEVVALVGESGSGKSMTARAIMGLLPPAARIEAGQILINGVDLVGSSETFLNRTRGRQVGLLFQQPRAALDPTSRVGHQVGEARRIHFDCSRREAWQTSLNLLGAVGIADASRRAKGYAHQMSGGMAQRILIASALSGEPQLLIADEPTTSLDVTVQAQILRLLAAKQAEHGLSILLITHDLGIVPGLADRVAVMYSGRIVEQGPVQDVLESPQHPYTRALLRASMLQGDADGHLYAIPAQRDPEATTSAGTNGCRFCTRCSLASDLGIFGHCAQEEPDLVLTLNQHSTRCWAVKESS